MELNNDRRGTFDHIGVPLAESACMLTYELPLGEIVLDYYDQLKSRTRGYASFDYDLAGFRPGDLVARRRPRRRASRSTRCRSIIHRDFAYDRGPAARRASCARRSRARCSTSRSRRRSARA